MHVPRPHALQRRPPQSWKRLPFPKPRMVLCHAPLPRRCPLVVRTCETGVQPSHARARVRTSVVLVHEVRESTRERASRATQDPRLGRTRALIRQLNPLLPTPCQLVPRTWSCMCTTTRPNATLRQPVQQQRQQKGRGHISGVRMCARPRRPAADGSRRPQGAAAVLPGPGTNAVAEGTPAHRPAHTPFGACPRSALSHQCWGAVPASAAGWRTPSPPEPQQLSSQAGWGCASPRAASRALSGTKTASPVHTPHEQHAETAARVCVAPSRASRALFAPVPHVCVRGLGVRLASSWALEHARARIANVASRLRVRVAMRTFEDHPSIITAAPRIRPPAGQ